MSSNILFDNLLITDDFIVADEWAAVTYDLKRKQIDLQSVSHTNYWITLTQNGRDAKKKATLEPNHEILQFLALISWIYVET